MYDHKQSGHKPLSYPHVYLFYSLHMDPNIKLQSFPSL